ncbi:hypothetical protein KGF57_003929 [Candida theae]|uniref:Smr domain-containing protein n=1 Tax=Candida theae TaxID=1198502 RepID=A0AAD5FXI2_9ASCO|nr:uncharacterized protein KGF57_003929 [Candida theae]KAI5953720.1 hypothetical protein KGF57_003929 [Candida theae]
MADILDRGAKLFDGPERDYNHATDSQYHSLRAKADEFYKKRNNLSQQSQAAYKAGDKQRAHELSEQSKQALNQAENYSEQAAEYVFRENNTDSAADEIDLHGLYVKEAKWVVQRRIEQAVRTNQSHLKVIVGKGNHSANGIAKLKPAIEELCSESNLRHYIDPKNTGVLVIDLNNASTSQIPNSWGQAPITQPQQAYLGSNQPHYSNQQQHHHGGQPHHQQPNNQDIKTGNELFDLLIKGLCMCLNKK